jgi:predicted transcriptional regulator
MKKTQVRIRVSSTEDFFARMKTLAQRLDRGEAVGGGIIVSFEDPQDMLRVLSSQRARLLRCVREQAMPIAVLASELQRDIRAVSRDVKLLEEAGLLRTSYQTNPGHGRLRIVEPVAQEYLLQASL